MLSAIAAVCELLPSVSENARNNASVEISSAIFLLECAACSACSACSRFSCAPIVPSSLPAGTMIAEQARLQRLALSGARMRAGIDLQQTFRVDSGVNLGCGKRGVTQQLLDRPQIAARSEERRVGKEG